MAQRKPLYMTAAGYTQEMDPATDGAEFSTLILNGIIDMNNNKITELATPTVATDAATKGYVDAVATGLDWKQSVRLATAAALPANTAAGSGVGKTLTADANGALSVDGVAVAVNDRVLVKNETPGSDNGIYTVTATGDGSNPYVLTRATDADQDAEVTAGLAVFATEGTTNGDTGWVLTTNDVIVVDTTALSFAQFASSVSYTFDQGLSNTAGSIKVELDTAADAQGAGAGGGSSGLEFDVNSAAGKLRAAVHATGGIERTATGLAAKLNGTSLVSAAGGLSVAYSPILQETRVANEAIAIADPVFQSTTSDRVGKALANTDAAANVVGVAISAAAGAGNNTDIVYHGSAAGTLSGATPGNQYYLQATGGIATTVPGSGNRIISVGFARTATLLHVRIVDYGKKAA